jgi:hypothetical protein
VRSAVGYTGRAAASALAREEQMLDVRRRQFITLLGGAAVA